MAVTNFIPTIWSETLHKELASICVAVNHCNRDFEGEIKGKGSSVKICGIGDISISNYSKNSDLSTPQTLSDTAMTLNIDQAKCFNFQIDDVDRMQASPKLMEAALQKAAEALAVEADRYIYNLYSSDCPRILNHYNSGESIYESIIKARELLYVNNVTDGTELFLEVTPKVASQILKEKIALPSTSESSVESGYLGQILGCKVYVSNNLTRAVNTGSTEIPTLWHNCMLRTRRAISFADQISEVEAYRPEKRFADAIKGLHLYGARIVYPKELINIVVELPE